jgi:soluble lytic murein transglycosylase
MPQTGQQLFDQLRLGDFESEMLEVGDLNLHLGTSYLVELLDRYGGDLPLALSGYNAGPHRADRWKDFPEAEDSLRFTERIPFAETRDYVKRIYRNRAIYRALYGPPSTMQ